MAFALNKLNTFVVLDSVSEASDSVRKNSRLTPNIVLLEASDKSDSASVIAMISKLFAGARIIMLGLPDAEQDIIASIEAGAAGCVFRNASFLELVEIIGSAARGEVVLSPKTAASLCRRLAGFASSNKPLMGGNQPLTRREREIVPLIAGGLQNKEIAVRLGVEVQTVKNHVHNILEKLQVHSRHHIARHLNLLSVLTCFWFISAGRYGLYWCVFSYSA
jgi:DNA-binding NarL/FixJ family response regulator